VPGDHDPGHIPTREQDASCSQASRCHGLLTTAQRIESLPVEALEYQGKTLVDFSRRDDLKVWLHTNNEGKSSVSRLARRGDRLAFFGVR